MINKDIKNRRTTNKKLIAYCGRWGKNQREGKSNLKKPDKLKFT